MTSLKRQLFVLLLAVLVTVGMGLSVVQADTMHQTKMNMSSEMNKSADMTMSGLGHCPTCPKTADGKSMPGCLASSCAALVAVLNSPVEQINLVFRSIQRFDQTLAPDGAGSEPARYPPRTIHIG